MARVAVEGVELFYDEREGGDPPVVFVHGWTCNHTFFAPQFEHLAGRHRVVALDLRGHGASAVPEAGYTIATMADDVAGLCRALALEHPVVVGHSMGGAVAVELAARHRHLPRALVLVDPAPIVAPPEMAAFLETYAARLAGPDATEQRRRFVQDLLFLPTDDPVIKAAVVEQMSRPTDDVGRQCFEALARWQGVPSLAASDVPVLAVHAEPAINDADALAAVRPGVYNVRTTGVGHFNQLLAPAEVSAFLDRFLSDVVLAGPRP